MFPKSGLLRWMIGTMIEDFVDPRKRLLEIIAFQAAQLEILRTKAPNQLRLTVDEKMHLLRMAEPLDNPDIRLYTHIVHPRTLFGWRSLLAKTGSLVYKKLGRPRIDPSVVQLLLRIARENILMGHRKIYGELRKVGIGLGKSTVNRYLKENGIEPVKRRAKRLWRDFVSDNFESLWACDFLEVEVDIQGRLETRKVFAFIHYGSRHIWIAGVTKSPNAQWVDAKMRKFIRHCERLNIPCTELVSDNDPVFTSTMEDILDEADINLMKILAGVPKMNAYAERINRTLQEECLNHFILFSEEHMMSLLREFERYYNQYRPHRAFDLNPLTFENRGPENPTLKKAPTNIKTIQFMGGLHTAFYVDGEPKFAA